MIKNKIIEIYPDTIEDITAEANANNFYLVNLDGRTIHNEQEYIHAMKVHFKFPYGSTYNVYFDWITDLGWLQDEGYKGFGLIIDYYKSFLDKDNTDFKEYLNTEGKGFNDITRYWEYDVIKYVSGGEPMPFNIYLVDR